MPDWPSRARTLPHPRAGLQVQLPKLHSATRRQVGQAGSRPGENFKETAKPELRKVRPMTLIASSDGFCCVQSAQGPRNVIEFEMPYSMPRTLCVARANSGLGIRSRGGCSFAAAIFVLWAGTLPAQQASHESNWNPEWDRFDSGSSISSSNSYGGPQSTSNTYGSSSTSSTHGLPMPQILDLTILRSLWHV